jgi:hypothetical protein
VSNALAGDFAPMERLVAKARLPIAQLLIDEPTIRQYFNPAQTYATSCHDYPRVYSYADPITVRQATYDRALDALDPSAFYPFSPTAWTQSGIEGVSDCIDWPDDPTAVSPLPADTRMPNVPVLVLSGDLDANTPSSDGREVAAAFPRGRFVEVPDVGHTPTDGDTCGVTVGLAFIKTLTAAANACVGTGTPVTVTSPDPRTAAGVRPVAGNATMAQRQAIGLVVATAVDLEDQLDTIDGWGGATGLRGGTYTAQDDGSITLIGTGRRGREDQRLAHAGHHRHRQRRLPGNSRPHRPRSPLRNAHSHPHPNRAWQCNRRPRRHPLRHHLLTRCRLSL